VLCWGWNDAGQLGDGTTTDRRTPVDVVGLTRGVAALAVGGLHNGSNHTCAITNAGAVMCWGANGYGQLGDGTNDERHVPVPVVGLGDRASAAAIGGYHTCALLKAGTLACWGRNADGQLGDGTTIDRSRPVQVRDEPVAACIVPRVVGLKLSAARTRLV
jgi:alpha-tubulin suppressor-like RCC1 family protein